MRFNILLAALAIGLTGCFDFETQLDLDTGSGPDVLVVNGFLEAGKPASVQISSTQSALTGYYPFFPHEALAVIYGPGNTPFDTLQYAFEKYSGKRALLPSSPYEIRVSHYGFPDATAQFDFPPRVFLSEITHETTVRQDEYSSFREFALHLNLIDPAGEQFYVLEMAIKWNADTDYDVQYWETQDPDFGADFSGSSDIRKRLPYGSFRDVFFDGKPVKLSIYPELRYPASEDLTLQFRLRLYSISKASFDYLQEVYRQQEQAGNPFTEPIEVTGNVRGGLGAVGGYQVDAVTFSIISEGEQ